MHLAHSEASEGKTGALTVKAGTPVHSHSGQDASPVIPGSFASKGSGVAEGASWWEW